MLGTTYIEYQMPTKIACLKQAVIVECCFMYFFSNITMSVTCLPELFVVELTCTKNIKMCHTNFFFTFKLLQGETLYEEYTFGECTVTLV